MKESRLKVRDLKALLTRLETLHASPDDTIVFARDDSYVLLVRARAASGMHQPVEDGELELTTEDREFLRSLRIEL